MMKKIELTQEECYCSILEFYENVAKKLMEDTLDEMAEYDCRHIRVTDAVREECFRYYKNERNAQEWEISMLILLSGPKADLEEEGYAAEVDDNFICMPEE